MAERRDEQPDKQVRRTILRTIAQAAVSGMVDYLVWLVTNGRPW
jgi:hypothetical protein